MAIAVGTDSAVMAVLAASNAFDADSASTFDSILNNLEELLHNVELGAGSRPFFVATPQITKCRRGASGRRWHRHAWRYRRLTPGD